MDTNFFFYRPGEIVILVQLAYEFGAIANIQKYESDKEVCTEMHQYLLISSI